jgi:2-polyprenyl-3-methyl-5-hydroxy-6-metoxy-1,4-benzoquinol methylase
LGSDDQARWDKQHAEARSADTPASFLRQVFENDGWQLPRGRALDIACGMGRNALYLAEQGFEVVAMDISAVALQEARKRAELKRLRIDWRQTDLEAVRLDETAYDLIVNFNYLQHSLIPHIKRAIKSGGHVVFETYLIDQKEHGHPNNPDYLLRHNELLEHFRQFRVLCYREGKFSDDSAASYRAGILARRIA